MSLKAKIEAVIYAAEEPVSLARLASLFQTELLEERQTRLSAEAASAEAVSAVEPDVAEEPALTLENAAVLPEEAPAGGTSTSEEYAQIVGDASVPESGPSPEDEKRASRVRDREVREEARRIVQELIAEYDEGNRGMEIREIAGGYRVATKPEYHDAVRAFVKSLKPPMKLSLQALETLAVIAYKQPVTAPEVSEIRGVDSGGVLGSLVSRKLVTTAGRKQVIGRPILYKTTKEFLLRFGLKDLNELPSIEEFEKMAGELAETEDAAPEKELPFEGGVEAEGSEVEASIPENSTSEAESVSGSEEIAEFEATEEAVEAEQRPDEGAE